MSSCISWSFLKFVSVESVRLSNHLILCSPLLLLLSVFSSLRVFSKESDLHITWPKCWSCESESDSRSVLSSSLQPHGLYGPWNSQGQSTGVGSFSLLHGIFATQGLSPGLPHCGWILYQMSHKGSPIYSYICSFSDSFPI